MERIDVATLSPAFSEQFHDENGDTASSFPPRIRRLIDILSNSLMRADRGLFPSLFFVQKSLCHFFADYKTNEQAGDCPGLMGVHLLKLVSCGQCKLTLDLDI